MSSLTTAWSASHCGPCAARSAFAFDMGTTAAHAFEEAGPPLERAVHKMRQPLGMLLAGAQCIGLKRQHGAKGGSELVSEEERNALRAQRLVEAA